eukprot:3115894-Lingulodinium_polyedra.AAC.1
MQGSQMVLYMPPGWLAAERTLNNTNVLGLKVATTVPANFDFASFLDVLARKRLEDGANKTLAFTNAYHKFITTPADEPDVAAPPTPIGDVQPAEPEPAEGGQGAAASQPTAASQPAAAPEPAAASQPAKR